MTLGQPLIATGRVDRGGRLIAADPRLLALQVGAGGEQGGVLLIPALASLVRLARTLGVLVSRSVIAADGDADVDLWVRAKPEGEDVALAIAGWDVRPDASARPSDDRRAHDFAELQSDGNWACNAGLGLESSSSDLLAATGEKLDTPITRMFRLIEDVAGDLPLLTGIAARVPFADQVAELRGASGAKLLLHGSPRFSHGEYQGFSGGFRWLDRAKPASPTSQNSADHEDVSKRLDHALRSPLNRIIASADQIVFREHGAVRQNYINYASDISAAGRHLLGLVDDLSDFQAAETLDFRIAPESLDLADLVRRAAGLMAVRAADRGIRIDAPAPDEIVSARGDFRRVLQILVNLLGNALRYSPPDGSVWIRTEEEGDLACIIIADQGKGIAAADQERIFDKFERIDVSEPGGTGLGLYISRQLARAMGGDITVDSAPGMGARFILTLPRG